MVAFQYVLNLGSVATAYSLHVPTAQCEDAFTHPLLFCCRNHVGLNRYYHYVRNIINEITAHLGIKCLSIDISWMNE